MPLLPPEMRNAEIPLASADSQTGQPATLPGGDAVSNLDKWVDFLCQAEMPVLRSSIDELARLKQNEDCINARDISGVILRDPMLTLNVLRYLQEHRRNSRTTEITTVGHAVMMLGITPFFRQFRDMKVVEEVLAGRPYALEGFMGVVNRVRHAALHAREWAALRLDIESDEVIIAALLHDVAEMLLWCLAPESAMQIAGKMRQDKTLRSAVAQESVLGFSLVELRLNLVEKLHLPVLLKSLLGDDRNSPPRARIVALAVALARHSANGWDDAALSDDYAAIRKLLALPRHDVMTRIHRVALRAIRRLDRHGELRSAAWLPPMPPAWVDAERDGNGEDAVDRPAVVKRVAELLTVRAAQNPDFLEMLALLFHGLHAGVGLERVLFMAIDDAHSKAAAKYVGGAREASRLQQFQIDLLCPHVFSGLVAKGAGIWYRAAAHPELPAAVPVEISGVIGDNEFFAMAIPVNGNLIGLIYADGGCQRPLLAAGQYEEFQRLCMLLAKALERGPRTGHFV